jgi:uncharacterized radical SAM superfamily Fe-S cluster-containing enzyme
MALPDAIDHPAGLFPSLAPDGPVLIFGGCYGNLEAARALQAEARRLAIPAERVICTGDVVAYCADPAATIDLVRDWGIPVVMGNCEESLGWREEDCGCGFAADTACERMAVAWYAYADAAVNEEQRRWMRALPRRIDLWLAGRRLAVVHGAVDSINRFIFRSTPWREKERQIALSGGDGVIGGHCGLPFTEAHGGRLWHNSGAIGMPANDGTPRVWYSLLSPAGDGIEIRAVPFAYDAAAAAEKMRARGLPEGYAAALETGLWPSCDVLPVAEVAKRGEAIAAGSLLWNGLSACWPQARRRPERRRAHFRDPQLTADGEPYASVPLQQLETLWFNTGTLCNLACANCYIESSPNNDRLVYLRRAEVRRFLAEATASTPLPGEIGFTGGEPFLNPEILGMIEDSLAAGFRVLVLTNAMRPMQRLKAPLCDLHERFPDRLSLRVSLDHYDRAGHEELRGPHSWERTIAGLVWLAQSGFAVTVAGRTVWGESETRVRDGYRRLFAALGLTIDAGDPGQLVLFPEMKADEEVPEITERCWDTFGKSPASLMCATSRMVVKRKGADRPAVVSCTLLPYESAHELGASLAEAARAVRLDHRSCAQFCVFGGASCSAG